ncbi:MAG: hypothetical protein BWY92_00636 [Firmicutes bacterium ADurb.BinA052]|nr:MAG: hypothetical protein BWY92_00636 [Firmicutes bacterium ADurb.BinA052]
MRVLIEQVIGPGIPGGEQAGLELGEPFEQGVGSIEIVKLVVPASRSAEAVYEGFHLLEETLLPEVQNKAGNLDHFWQAERLEDDT